LELAVVLPLGIGEESAVRLDPSPIPRGKPTACPNRAYLSLSWEMFFDRKAIL